MDHTLFQFTGVKTHLGFWTVKKRLLITRFRLVIINLFSCFLNVPHGILPRQTDIVQAINTA